MAGTLVIYCHGDKDGPCGLPVLLVRRGDVLRIGAAEITGVDRRGTTEALCPMRHKVRFTKEREGSTIKA